MRKLLTITISAAALMAGAANAKITEGFNVGLSTGYSQNKLELKSAAKVGYLKNKPRSTAAANVGLHLGYTKAIQEKFFVNTSILAGYNFANVKVAEGTAFDPEDKINYKPRFNFGLGLKAGMCISENMNAYLGMNFLREASQIILKEAAPVRVHKKIKATVYTLTPLLGVNASVADKVSVFAEAGYKITMKTSVPKTFKTEFKEEYKKPRGFVANVGVTYHF